MAEDANKVLIQQYFEEITNQGNLSAVEQYVSPDFIDHDAPTGLMLGTEGVKQTITLLHAAFPDLKVTIEDIVAEGNKVVVRNTWRGTHKGHFLGVPPTHQPVTMTGIVIWRIADGKIMERWATIDRSQVLNAGGK